LAGTSWTVRSGANSGAGVDVLALQVAWSSNGVLVTLIALLTIINNAITAGWFHAVLSAFVWEVGVVIALIALLTSFNFAVTTDSTSSSGPGNLSAVQGLDWARVGSTDGLLEELELLRRDGLRLGQHIPGNLLRARWGSEGTNVSGNRGRLISEQRGQGEGSGTTVAASAPVICASGGAAINSEVVVGVWSGD